MDISIQEGGDAHPQSSSIRTMTSPLASRSLKVLLSGLGGPLLFSDIPPMLFPFFSTTPFRLLSELFTLAAGVGECCCDRTDFSLSLEEA